jgi:hypothetical protein
MQKFRRSPISLITLLVVIGSIALAINALLPASPKPQERHANPVSLPAAPGLPAIHPTRAGIPAYTVADVQAYVLTAGFSGGPTSSGKSPTILNITFITARAASTLVQADNIGLPDDALVCYVVVQGPFEGKRISSPDGASVRHDFPKGQMFFDAQAGNLLGWAGLP